MPKNFGEAPPSKSGETRRYEPDDEGFESHQLEMDDIEMIPAGDEVYIPGLGPCMGVVIYEPSSRRALATHLAGTVYLAKVIDQARDHFGSFEKLEAYLAGCSPEADKKIRENGGPESVSADQRKEVIDALRREGVAMEKITTQFNDDPSYSVAMTFDTRTAKVTLEKGE